MAIGKLFNQLTAELEKAKLEKPKLLKDKEASSIMLDESTNNTPRPFFFHTSHNSHGDWGKHWAHGGFEEDETQDNSLPKMSSNKS